MSGHYKCRDDSDCASGYLCSRDNLCIKKGSADSNVSTDFQNYDIDTGAGTAIDGDTDTDMDADGGPEELRD